MRKNFKNSRFIFLVIITGLTASFISGCADKEITKLNDEPVLVVDKGKIITFVNPVSNADGAYDAFVKSFVVKDGAGQTYIVDGLNARTRAYFWGQGFMITAMEDACERNPTATRKKLVIDLLNSFLNKETHDWSWNSWTDDIAWADIAVIRGYLITGDQTYRTVAADNWNFAFNRLWDNALGGGLWENTDKYTKASLANNPMIISGIFLYEATGDVNYLNKCKQIYAWFRSSGIYNTSTGVVNEAKVNDGTIQYSDNSYNQGSFVNAAASLYKHTGDVQYLNDAKRTADHIKNNWPIFNQEADGCVRGIAKLARENNLESTYYPWLANNCNSAWNKRRPYYNITNNNWTTITPVGEQFSMQCVSAVTVQMVTPEQIAISIPDGTYKVLSRQNGYALTANGTANLATLSVAAYTGTNSQRWIVTSLGNGNYKLIGVASGRSLDASGASTLDGAGITLWDYQNATNQTIYFSSPASGYYTMYFVHSNKVVDVNDVNNSIDQMTDNGSNNQQWQFLVP